MTLVKHNNKLRLTDEYASIIEKGGKYPRTILRNQDNNSPTNGLKW